MGASGWRYIVPFQPDIQAALDLLRQTEFEAWKRNHPRKKYKNIDALLKGVGADGTSSILDVDRISATPLPAIKRERTHYDFHNPKDMERFVAEMNEYIGRVFPLSSEDYLALFGTTRPVRQNVEQSPAILDALYERIKRGSGVYLVLYQNEVPTEIYFIGISGD